MKSKDYWANRAAKRMYDYMEDTEGVAKTIAEAYQKSMHALNKEAETILRTFQSHHNLTDAEARLLIRNARGKTVTDKLKSIISQIPDEEKQAKIRAAIDAPAYQWRIARLEALQKNIDRQCTTLYGMEQQVDTAYFSHLCTEAYKRTMFDIQKGTGLGFSFAQMPTSRINEILKNPWIGAHYSSRIWGHVSDMGDRLKDEMLVSFITGRSQQKTAEAVATRFGVGASDARRLVRTESCYIANQAEMDSYKECGVDKYEFVATLDIRTSEACRNLDGKVFPVAKQRPGVNAPPMHPYCRSTTIAVFDDAATEGLQRRARDPETGKNELVPADMTYPEWGKWIDEKYGAGTVEKHREKLYNENLEKLKLKKDKEQFARYQGVLKELAPKSFSEFRDIKQNNPDKWKTLKHQYRTVNQYKIDSGDIGVRDILDLDEKVITEKRGKFTSDYKRSGNIAGAYIDGDKSDLYLAHSKINTTKEAKGYKGSSKIVELCENRRFSYIDVPSKTGIRTKTYCDTEAKLFEHFADMYDKKPFASITMLSERGMCDSCKGVMQQFKEQFPNVTINVVSNKKVNGNVWKYRRN